MLIVICAECRHYAERLYSEFLNAECVYSEFLNAECVYSEFLYAECLNAVS
jgi:hypothetical protein